MMKTFDRNSGKSLTLRASCIRNLFHQDRQWMENSVATFWSDWGTTSGVCVRTSGATTPGSGIMTVLRHTCCLLCSSVLASMNMSYPPPSLLTGPCPPVIFSCSQKMKLKIKGRRLTELKRSRPNCRTWGRHWCKMSSISASNHEVPLESLYQCQRG